MELQLRNTHLLSSLLPHPHVAPLRFTCRRQRSQPLWRCTVRDVWLVSAVPFQHPPAVIVSAGPARSAAALAVPFCTRPARGRRAPARRCRTAPCRVGEPRHAPVAASTRRAARVGHQPPVAPAALRRAAARPSPRSRRRRRGSPGPVARVHGAVRGHVCRPRVRARRGSARRTSARSPARGPRAPVRLSAVPRACAPARAVHAAPLARPSPAPPRHGRGARPPRAPPSPPASRAVRVAASPPCGPARSCARSRAALSTRRRHAAAGARGAPVRSAPARAPPSSPAPLSARGAPAVCPSSPRVCRPSPARRPRPPSCSPVFAPSAPPRPARRPLAPPPLCAPRAPPRGGRSEARPDSAP